MNPKHLMQELKRRNVFKVATVYAIAGWVIIQLAATLTPILMLPSWVPRVITLMILLGFPITVIIAWAFELTPEGVKRTDEIPAEKYETKKTGRKLNTILVIMLILAVGGLFYQHFATGSSAATKQSTSLKATADSLSIPAKSIAVLPFENLSTDSANAYFADGMQDEILTKLADIGALAVISRTSTEKYGSHPEDIKTIARQLGVATILEGSVQKAGNQVLINVQLINAGNDHHIWAKSYQRTLYNIFGVEGEVAEKVASALQAKLDPAEQARVASVPTRNPDAYDAYLRGLSIESTTSDLNAKSLETVASYYEQAVKLDPGFALAWAHLSSVNSNISSFGNSHSTQLVKAKTALDKAVALAPDAIATQIAKGDYAYYGHRDYANALVAYHKALQISPNDAIALLNIGFVERREGHWQTAINYMNRSLDLDPRNVNTLSNLAMSYWALRRDAKAKELLQQALAIHPGDPGTVIYLARLYQSEGDLVKAEKILEEAKISPINPELLPSLLLNPRNYTEAIHLLKAALAQENKLPENIKGLYYDILGFAEQLSGYYEAAHIASKRAIKALQKVPETQGTVFVRAMCQARLGQKTAALASAHHIMAMLPPSRDAFAGPLGEFYLAVIQAQVGEKSLAIATLKQLLAMPPGNAVSTTLTPALLRIDPIWDPLRSVPAFKALLKKYASKKQEAGS